MAKRSPFQQALDNKIAMTQDADVVLCGRLLTYTVPDAAAITPVDLKAHYQSCGAEEKFFPGPIRRVDAFRRATSSLRKVTKSTSQELADTGVAERRYECQDPSADTRDRLVRHLVRIDVHPAKQGEQERLEMVTVAKLSLERSSHDIVVEVLDHGDSNTSELLSVIGVDYDFNCTYLDGDAIRRAMRAMVDSMDPVLIKDSGGSFFIPVKYEQRFWALRRLLDALQFNFTTFPLVDSADARETVGKLFLAQTHEIMENIAQALGRPEELSKGRVTELLEQASTIRRQLADYGQLLRKDMLALDARNTVLERQMDDLLKGFLESKAQRRRAA